MKRYAVFFAVGLIGVLVGASVAGLYCGRMIDFMFPSGMRCLEERQRDTCVTSLAALNFLERGDTDSAKVFLAREVADYYRHPFTQGESPERKKLLTTIDTVRAKSSILDRELRKDSK
jgi:hypothetical protein